MRPACLARLAVDDDLFHPQAPVDKGSRWRQCVRRPTATQEAKEVCYQLGAEVVAVNTASRLLRLADGSSVSFGQLVLATGGADLRPALEAATADEAVLPLRAMHSWNRTEARVAAAAVAGLAGARGEVAVVGTGVAAVELACAIAHPRHSTSARRELRRLAVAGALDDDEGAAALPGCGEFGVRVSLQVPEPAPLSRLLPRYLSNRLASQLKAAGVSLECFSSLQHVGRAAAGRVEPHGRAATASVWRPRVSLNRVASFDAMRSTSSAFDLVLLAPDRVPARTGLADQGAEGWNGVSLDRAVGGIAATADLLAAGGVFAAGSVAALPAPLRGRARDQSREGALVSGWTAGRNAVLAAQAAGAAGVPADAERVGLPAAWEAVLGQVGVRLTLVGEVDSSLETVGCWEAPPRASELRGAKRRAAASLRRGVVFYLRRGRVVGAVVWDRIPRSRACASLQQWLPDDDEGEQEQEQEEEEAASDATEAGDGERVDRPSRAHSAGASPSAASAAQDAGGDDDDDAEDEDEGEDEEGEEPPAEHDGRRPLTAAAPGASPGERRPPSGAVPPPRRRPQGPRFVAGGSLFDRLYGSVTAGNDPVREAEAEVAAVPRGAHTSPEAVVRHMIRVTGRSPLADEAEARVVLSQAASLALDAARRQDARAGQEPIGVTWPAERRWDAELSADGRSRAAPAWEVASGPPLGHAAAPSAGGGAAEAAAVAAALAGASSLAPPSFLLAGESWRRLGAIEDADTAARAAARLQAKAALASERSRAAGSAGHAPSAAASLRRADAPSDAVPSMAATRSPATSDAAVRRQDRAAAAALGSVARAQSRSDSTRLIIRTTPEGHARPDDGGVDVLVPGTNRSSQSRREAFTAAVRTSADVIG
ncbi:hypothetical protein FNF28_05820 [Cafeteria roenbergensis]|uniref:FAD/NAD(P)-binding domain-containing protein n=1 Tax=Cafeteria roenbergensis TaxID=33653 RepID=A0A5A8D330_CAFRO|nr:hypothetical protein FNF28_05820 [Cafeteria roenbergensis]